MTSRGRQQNHQIQPEDEAWRAQRVVGKRALEGIMGLQNDLSDHYGRNPFSVAYEVEAIIPMEIGLPFLRRETYNQEENFALQWYELNLLEEKCDLVALRVASYKQRFERYFNSKVKEKRFKEGNLVLWKVGINTKEVSAGVFGPNWEGPYIIEEVVQPGTYKRKRFDGSTVPRTWNAKHLRPYYQ